MKGSEQDKVRRQHIFSILDDLKEKGERINADKVARIGKMGKQTVLPYYNEWRYLGALGEAEELELPDDLVRGLKRGIAQWKHQLSEKQRSFEESANQEIDELKESLNQLLEKNSQLSRSNSELQDQVQQLSKELDDTKLNLEQSNQSLKEMESLLKSEQIQTEQLQSAAAEQKAHHLQAISSLERQMDQRSQEQLNHWISVVDDERRLKQGLEKKISNQLQEQQELKKHNLELQSRLDSKSKAYIQVCEERNDLSSEKRKVEGVVQIANQLMVLLDCDQDSLLGSARSLLVGSRESYLVQEQYKAAKSDKEKLENRLLEAEEQLDEIATLRLELERTRGIAEAFEKALSKRTESSEVMQ
ncbi:DNA-binding protein [Endozoicomonas atrinae]|uniref:DNA-binding protein n=1 Tax=Endozoicomonas atrinae TaxID=1333660 RepID=UPI00082518F8|nr:DNA-binding protein [Endozoicomonas atrinae]